MCVSVCVQIYLFKNLNLSRGEIKMLQGACACIHTYTQTHSRGYLPKEKSSIQRSASDILVFFFHIHSNINIKDKCAIFSYMIRNSEIYG